MRIRMPLAVACLTLGLTLTASTSAADTPCVSGLKCGQRPGPYSFVVATGPQRGQSTCYVCDAGDRPMVIVFARNLSDPLGKLAGRIDLAVADRKADEVRGWLTLLGKGPDLENKLVEFGKKHAVRGMPLGVFEDAVGPPSYKLNKEADVTVLLAVKQKVMANFAFRAGELGDKKIEEIEKAVRALK